MALIVEDGTGVAGANTYASITTVDAYHLARGNTSWTGTDAAKESAILRAMGYIEGLAWQGEPLNGPVGASGYQPLQWPRYGVAPGGLSWPAGEIHPGVINALCEAALVELSMSGALAPELERGGLVVSEKVDVIETVFASGAPAGTVYRAVSQHLRGLLRGGGCAVDMVRG